jgi:hypothetical protein
MGDGGMGTPIHYHTQLVLQLLYVLSPMYTWTFLRKFPAILAVYHIGSLPYWQAAKQSDRDLVRVTVARLGRQACWLAGLR